MMRYLFGQTIAFVVVLLSCCVAAHGFAQQPRTESQRLGDRGDLPDVRPPTSPTELRPGAGEMFVEPPPIPPVPQSLTEQMVEPDQTPMTLEMLESIACQRNPTLAQARAQVQGELAKAIQAGLWPNPRVRYVGEQWGVGGTAGEWQGMEVSQRVVTARKLDLSRAKFLAHTRTAQWHALEQQYQVLNDLRIHFWRALGQQELVELQEELLKNAEDGVITARELYNLGQATRADVHKANIRLQQSRLNLLLARNNLRQTWWELIAIAGVQMPQAPLQGTLEGAVSPMEFDAALQRLFAESPQLLAARSKLRADQIKVKREVVEPIPDLVVTGGSGYNFEAKETTYNTAVQIELPLYDWNQGTIRQAEADVIRQRAELERIELMLQRQLAQVYQQYLTAMQNVRSFQSVIVPEARAAYEVLLDAYEEDRVDWPQVLDTELEYFSLRTQYIEHLIAWRSGETLIRGYLLHGGLLPPTGATPPGHISATPKPR